MKPWMNLTGDNPPPDIGVSHPGGQWSVVYYLEANSKRADKWLRRNLPDAKSQPKFQPVCIAVDQRYVEAILAGAVKDGLTLGLTG